MKHNTIQKVCTAAAFTLLASSDVLCLEVQYSNKGVDGPLIITTNATIDLSKSATRGWDAPPEVIGDGVYDPQKWAVVFKYTSVTIKSNAKVTFANHPSRAPVIWLVDGDVTIEGTLSLNGANGDSVGNVYRLSEPGPGGFRGGETITESRDGAAGFGPGGTFVNYLTDRNYRNYQWQAPSYQTVGPVTGGASPAPVYGNARIVPLMGGSGGAGVLNDASTGGGAGGGAILIVAQGAILINGVVEALGGKGALNGGAGAIRLVGRTVGGVGRIDAQGHGSGDGRIRIEADDYQGLFSSLIPVTQAVRPDSPVMVWPSAGVPSARIVSVSGVPALDDPRSVMGPPSPLPADVTLQDGPGSGVILIETENLPKTAKVMLRISPRHGAAQEVQAGSPEETSVPNRLLWRVVRPLSPGYAALQVRATAR